MKEQIILPPSFFLGITISSFLVGTIIGSIVTYILLCINPPQPTIPKKQKNIVNEEKVLVKKVLDGDTIIVELDNEEKSVRYLGIDAPEDKKEQKSFYGVEALNKNKQLVAGKEVTLRWHSDLQYGRRLIAYVYVGETFVNAELLKGGYASVYRRKRNFSQHPHYQLFDKLEQEARAEQRGIWNLKAKNRWEQQYSLNIAEKPTMYIAGDKFFHRPHCPKVSEIKFKCYYYSREKAIRDRKRPCKICNP